MSDNLEWPEDGIDMHRFATKKVSQVITEFIRSKRLERVFSREDVDHVANSLFRSRQKVEHFVQTDEGGIFFLKGEQLYNSGQIRIEVSLPRGYQEGKTFSLNDE